MSRQLLLMALGPLLGLFVLGIGNGFLTTLTTLRLDAAGASPQVIGWVSSAYFIGLGVGALVNDRLLLAIGHIRAYGSFASLLAVSVLLQGMLVEPVTWFVLRLVAGWATVGVFLVIESWLLTAGDDRLRGRLLALYMIVVFASGAIGQLLFGLTQGLGPTEPFMLIGLLASLSVLPMAIIPRVTPLLEKAEPLSPLRLITLTPTGVMGSFGSGIAVAAVYTLLPLYLQRSGLAADRIGLLMAVVVLGAMLLQYPVGRWSDRHDRQMVLIGIGGFCTLICAGILLLPLPPWGLAVLLFLLGGGVFSLYPVAVSHSADRAPAGALVRMSQGLLLINAVGATLSPSAIGPVMTAVGDAGLFWSLGALGIVLVAFFAWRRSVRPAPVPVAPFSPVTPLSAAELAVTEEWVQGALEHEHVEDLSEAVPDVEVAEPLVGPPPPDAPHIVYYDDAAPAEAEPVTENDHGVGQGRGATYG